MALIVFKYRAAAETSEICAKFETLQNKFCSKECTVFFYFFVLLKSLFFLIAICKTISKDQWRKVDGSAFNCWFSCLSFLQISLANVSNLVNFQDFYDKRDLWMCYIKQKNATYNVADTKNVTITYDTAGTYKYLQRCR